MDEGLTRISFSCYRLFTQLCFFRQLMHQDKGELAVTTSQIDTESEAWLAFNQPLE